MITCVSLKKSLYTQCGIKDFPSDKGFLCFPTTYLEKDVLYSFIAVGRTATQEGTGRLSVSIGDGMGFTVIKYVFFYIVGVITIAIAKFK